MRDHRLVKHLLLFFSVLAFVALVWPLLQGRMYLWDDLGSFHLKLRVFYSDCLRRGEDFRWCPDEYCGFDYHGEGQGGMCHPLHLVAYKVLPLRIAFPLEFLSVFALTYLGMLLFLRRHGLGASGSQLGAILFTFSGYHVFHFIHLNIVLVTAHLPWLLICEKAVMCERRRWWAGLGIAVLTASQLLLGHPQSVWYSSLIESLYVLTLAATGPERGGGRRLLGVAWFKALGILLGAIQVLPTLAILPRTFRWTALTNIAQFGSMHPLNLLTLLNPYLFTARFYNPTTVQGEGFLGLQELGAYNGIIVPPLVAWMVVRLRSLDPSRRWLALWAFGLTVLGILLALGRYGPFHAVVDAIPIVNKFRIPARYIVLEHFGTAILAGLALDDLLGLTRDKAVPKWVELWPLAVPPVLVVLTSAAVWYQARSHSDSVLAAWTATDLKIASGLALALTAAALVALAGRGSRLALAGVTLFGVAEVLQYNLSYLTRVAPTTIAEALVPPADPPLPVLSAGYRYHNRGSAVAWLARRRLALGSQSAMSPLRLLDYDRQSTMRIAGVAWIHNEDGHWSAVSDPLPRVRLVSSTLVSSDPARDLERIDLPSQVVLSEAVGPLDGPLGRAVIVEDRPGKIVIGVESVARQVLTLGEGYDPNLKVEVNDHPRPLLRVNGDFVGCLIEPGDRRVVFRFNPRGFRVGAYLTGLGLALLVIDPLRWWQWRSAWPWDRRL